MPAPGDEARAGHDAEAEFDVWLRHVSYARSADQALLGELVEHYKGYAIALARRLHRDGEPIEDLVQVAMVALVQALQRFEPSRSIRFMAYATPPIIGSLKRHYRDKGWALRVPRRVHELIAPARQAAESLTAELGRPARAEEVAHRLGISVETLLHAEEAAHARATSSLDLPLNQDQTYGDLVKMDDVDLGRVENRLALRQALAELDGRDRKVLDLYFGREWSQRAIGERFGVSQMQVSRWIASAVKRLRSQLIGA